MFKAFFDKTNNFYSYIQAFFLAFYSPEIYKDVIKRWRGIGALYLLFVFSIASVPITVQVVQKINKYFTEVIEPNLNDMPTMTIHKGKIQLLDQTSPYWLKYDNHHQLFMVIDPSKSLSSSQTLFIPVYISKDTIQIQIQSFMNKETSTAYKIKIPNNVEKTIGAKEISTILSGLKSNINYTVYFSFVCLFWGAGIAYALFFALLGQFVSRILLKCRLTLAESMRLVCVSGTPGIIFLAGISCFWALNVYVVYFSVVIFLLYYLFGVRAFQSEQESTAL